MARKPRGKKSSPSRRDDGRNCKSSENKSYRDNTRGGPRAAENDVSWYTRYPNLSVAAASFPFPYRPGMKLGMGTLKGGTTAANVTYPIPGVMSLSWIPNFGTSKTATDPASVMAKELYGRVRKAYAGSLDADGPDFVIFLGALDSLFAYIAWMKRVYRALNAWSPDNFVTPDGLLEAMNINATGRSNLRLQRMELWQYINELVYQSRKFTCPAIMDLFNRHYWMNDNVYTDSASINSQFYLFNMVGCYQYAPLAMPNGDQAAGLKMVKLPTGAVTASSLYQFGLDLINALVEWDDAYTINGYLSRAFQDSPMFMVDEIPQDQPFSPVYAEEVLTQIENSRVVPMGAQWDTTTNISNFTVTQDVLTNAILCNPRMLVNYDGDGTFAGQMNNIPPVISQRSDSPSVEMNIIATRLQAAVDVSTNEAASNWYLTIHAASEIPLEWKYLDLRPSTPAMFSLAQTYMSSKVASTGTLTRMFDIGAFDWHPLIFVLGSDNGLYIFGDVHNLTAISKADLDNLHRICMYSELNSFSVYS